MAESIDELFDCFDEGGDDNNEENTSEKQKDEHVTNRYEAALLT